MALLRCSLGAGYLRVRVEIYRAQVISVSLAVDVRQSQWNG